MNGVMTADPYEKNSWKQYKKHMKGEGEDRLEYVPSPKEIKQRIEKLRWLESKNLGSAIIYSVMHYDYPSISGMKRMIRVLGMREAKNRIRKLVRKHKGLLRERRRLH